MKNTILGTGIALLVPAFASPAGAQQVAYSVYPVFSNGYVVNIPTSSAAPTTTIYPGGVGSSVYPSPNVTLSGGTFVDRGPYSRTVFYPTTTPTPLNNPFAALGFQQGNTLMNPNAEIFRDSPLYMLNPALSGGFQPPANGAGFPINRR